MHILSSFLLHGGALNMSLFLLNFSAMLTQSTLGAEADVEPALMFKSRV
jgi:hypothetical protein